MRAEPGQGKSEKKNPLGEGCHEDASSGGDERERKAREGKSNEAGGQSI